MMPEHLVDKLTKEQVRDLIGYLATKEQVPLPPGVTVKREAVKRTTRSTKLTSRPF